MQEISVPLLNCLVRSYHFDLHFGFPNLHPFPTFTIFSFLIYFRMEKLKLRSLSSQAKVIGAMVSIAGALVVVLYDGPMLITGHNEKLSSPTHSIILRTLSDARSNWILGGALLAACYVVASIWYIFQVTNIA